MYVIVLGFAINCPIDTAEQIREGCAGEKIYWGVLNWTKLKDIDHNIDSVRASVSFGNATL